MLVKATHPDGKTIIYSSEEELRAYLSGRGATNDWLTDFFTILHQKGSVHVKSGIKYELIKTI